MILFFEPIESIVEFILIVKSVKISYRKQHVSCKETTVTRALLSGSDMPRRNFPRSVKKFETTINEVCIGRPNILLVVVPRVFLKFETEVYEAIREDLDESSLVIREPLFVLIKNFF
jgi:hypothetical protein